MSSRLTLAEVRASLYTLVRPDNANDAEFLRRLNLVCERIMLSGKWLGTKGVIDFASSADGFITLPRRYQSVLGYTQNNVPRPSYGMFHEYLEGGPGQLDEATMLTGRLVDMGQFPTMTAITTAGTLRLARGSGSDSAKTVRIYGLNADGDTIFDAAGDEGVLVTLSSATVDTTETFSVITGIKKEQTVARVTLSVVVAGTPTELSVYEPTETAPLYRRYKIGITEDPIRCLCKRRNIPLVDETDWVYPGNLGALGLGLQAIRFEIENDVERADMFWARCYGLLNDELRDNRGGQTINIKLMPGPKIPNRW